MLGAAVFLLILCAMIFMHCRSKSARILSLAAGVWLFSVITIACGLIMAKGA